MNVSTEELKASWADLNSKQQQLVNSFEERMEIEPIGFLHLEKLTFIPAGIERGELVYSLPLAPAEEVNISPNVPNPPPISKTVLGIYPFKCFLSIANPNK